MQLSFFMKKPPWYTVHECMSRKHGGFVMSEHMMEIPQNKNFKWIW